ncbi:MAG: hypothetical protein WA123_08155 [Methylotenera sp.]
MKFIHAGLLFLFSALVVNDVLRLVSNWDAFQPINVIVHLTFAVGVVVIVMCNTVFMLLRTHKGFHIHLILFLSFFAQIGVLGIFSLFIVAAWKSSLFNTVSWYPSSTLGNICLLLLLLSLFVGFLFWSKVMSMPNPSFKWDALKRAP